LLLARALLLLALAAGVAAPSAGATAPFTPWCGSDESAVDRLPDAVSAFEIHVVYAFPSDGTDRFSERASAIATDLASMDLWWRGQDPTRTPRFDLAAFPGCPFGLGQVDLSSVRLPQSAAAYGAGVQYALIRDDLAAAGFADPDKKYLVYYDGPPVPSGDGNGVLCGQSDTGIPGGGPRAYSLVYLGGVCGSGLGTGGIATVTATHELIHGLDALVFPGPPHACPGDPAHPCDSPNDILYPKPDPSVTLDSLTLDVGHDDYYGHSGSWYDVQDSPFLTRLDSADRAPPSTPPGFVVTSHDTTAVLLWQRSTDDVGPVTYRIYRDGELLATTAATRYDDTTAGRGGTHTYAVRAADAAGFLSGKPTLRFTVGLGIVDSSGHLVRDTVPPPAIGLIHPRATSSTVTFSWRGVTDPGGLRGYRVERNGRFYAIVARPTIAVPRSLAVATWTIRAVDRAGNLGRAAKIIVR